MKPARKSNLHRWHRAGWLLAIGISSALFWTGAMAQLPLALPNLSATPKAEVTKSSLTVSTTNTGVETDGVRLDGRRLFTIATPRLADSAKPQAGSPPLEERVEKIEETLKQVANSGFDPKTLKVTSTIDDASGQPVISIGDRYLMTVTSLDAQLQGQSPEQWTRELNQIIKDALLRAQRERQPDYGARQATIAAVILGSVLLASWVIAHLQRRQQRQREALKQLQLATEAAQTAELAASSTLHQTDLTVVQSQITSRQQRNLKDAQRRVLQLAQITLWAGGIYVILGLFYTTRSLQHLIFSTPLKLLSILLVTYVAIRISDVLIDRFFSASIISEFITSPTSSQRIALRVSTFSRVFRGLVGSSLVALALLSVLSTIGVNLAPVLAGAGILGLAISLASQNLIKDMINGMLILWEDQYAVGDVIEIDKVSGLVEYMNLRITQLRNAEGRLITVPNGAISVVQNLSKDWSRVDLGITIAYDADIDRALELIHRIGADMSHDLEWQSKIPEPPEVLGVDAISNEGVTIRVWIKTAPLEQWKVAREFRRRLKRALDAQGIAIGVPQQSFWFRNSASPADTALKSNQQHPG